MCGAPALARCAVTGAGGFIGSFLTDGSAHITAFLQNGDRFYYAALTDYTSTAARGIALLPNGTGGYTLDAAGGLHPFGGAANARAGAPSWPGQDKARGVTILPDGSGGWVVDSLGHVYPFGIGDNPKPPAPVGTPTWTVATARGVAALP